MNRVTQFLRSVVLAAAVPAFCAQAADTTPPTVASINPAAGTVASLTQITVNFSEPVSGVTADDLAVNGIAATGVTGAGVTYTFTFPQPPYDAVLVSFGTNSGIADLAVPPNSLDATAPGASWLYTLIDTVPPTVAELFPPAGAEVRALGQIEVTFSEDVNGVDAADLRVNNQPAASVVAQPGGRYVFQFTQPAPGPVTVAWAGGHGIVDLADTPNAFAGGSWNYTLDPNGSVGDLIINEILAANASTNGLKDPSATPEDPDPLPWLEIYNRGVNAVNLAGWSLSDDPEFPGQWVFPSKLLQPGQYLIVFTSGLDIKNPTGTNRFHTNFKLSKGGEFLGLYSPDSPRALVSGFTPNYPEQRNDKSYGYDAEGNLRYFNTPTPGAPNGGSTLVGVVEPVHFGVPRGHFTQPFNLTLSCPTPGATIRFTIDGKEPTETVGRPYVGALRLTNTTLLRAAAFRTNLLPSTIGTHSYLFNVSAAHRSLPIISIVTDQNNLTGPNGIIGISNVVQQGDGTYVPANSTGYHNPSKHGIAWERPTSVELIRPEDNGGFQVDAGIRVQGSDYQRPRTTALSKFSYRLYFRSDYGFGRLHYPMFPLTTVEDFDQMVLRAGFNENSNPFIRDEITRRMSHDMGDVASHGNMVVLYVNGQFNASSPYYNPCERVHEEMLQSYLGGGGEWDVVGPDFGQTAGLPGVIDGDRNNFANLMTNFWSGSAVRRITNQAAYLQAGKRLDLPNFVDYCLLNAYVAMGDWPANNWRAGRERSTNGPAGGTPWRYVGWDCEWAMGIYALAVTRDSFAFSGTGTDDAGLNSTGNSEIARTYQALRFNPEFRLLWADRIHKHFGPGGALTGANISNRFDQLRTELLGVIPAMDTEILGWARDRLPIIMGQFNTYGLYGYSNALYGIFASSNAPSFNQHGGRVAPGFSLTMTTPIPGSAIYYTTNGDDPRVMFTGAVSNSATAYAGPVTLNAGAQVHARALLNGTNWSAVNEATFEVARVGTPLRITEIHYNPADSPAYEFIELLNIGGALVDLGGMTFDGITYTFNVGTSLAPGAKLVLATSIDPTAFAARYPGVTVFGYFSGALNNGGERIALLDRFGNVITSVDYRDSAGWPTAADGQGASLEIIDPAGDPDDPANWRASSTSGGTPGAMPGSPALGAISLNEVMAENLSAVNNGGTYPDWVELRNTSGNALSLAGWSLTDDGNARKFIFPGGTIIPAGGYFVVWCDDATNTTPGLHTGFSFGKSGDNVYLYDPSTNRADALTFGLQLANYSVGRGPAGGTPGSWQLNTPTPNAANTAAPVASSSTLSINEWLANPPAGLPDWLEIFNPAPQPVALQGIYLATTGAVHQVTSLSFIGAFGFAQLFADEGVGPDHLDFKLPAIGGSIILYDQTATEVNRVSYSNAVEGVSRGRLPDGSATVVNFPGSASPGASNYLNSYTGPVLNEVLARNQTAVTNAGNVADYIELFNGGASAFNLGGMSLSVNSQQSGEWIFPPTASVPAGGYLVIWCDGSRPASTNSGNFNTGESLDGESGGVYLFNPGGQLVNSVEYGFQVTDRPIGLNGSQWRLLTSATPGAANAAPAALGTIGMLRLNEWMANPAGDGPAGGNDWFEVYNTTNLPVDMNGMTLTDDPSTVGVGQFRVAPLSFIGPNGFTQWIADGDPEQGRNHVNFSLDAGGETLRLYSTNGTNFVLVDSISFGAQLLAVSEGRLLDGESNFYAFPGSATPGAPNALVEPAIVINEILSHTDPPLEDAIELFNRGTNAVNIGGWFLSNSQDDFKKYRIVDNTIVPAGGYAVLYQYQFGGVSPTSFTLNSAHGDEVWLSSADPVTGRLTGYRASAKFGAAANGVSFGRYATSMGVDYVPMSALSLGTSVTAADPPGSLATFRTGTGAPNPVPQIGPVVINEILYNPVSGGEEYIELRNITGTAVNLYDAAFSTNRWRLGGGIDFTFPASTTLAANGYLLVVEFDPIANPAALTAFRARYGISAAIPVYGPFSGRLSNDGEAVELRRPDAPQGPSSPDAGFVPYLVTDKVDYTDEAPWPSGLVDGGGLSLQRKSPSAYGNEPLNWVAGIPTPGAANDAGIVPPPTILTPPQSQSVFEGAAPMLNVVASGVGELSYQWRLNGTSLPNATNSSYLLDYVVDGDEGLYDVLVSNPGGASLGGPAVLTVRVPPMVLFPPVNQFPRPGNTSILSVVVRGDAPLSYQWQFNGVTLPGETNTTLIRTNIQLADDGLYEVLISNPVATTISSATVTVLSNTIIVLAPITQSVITGSVVTVSVEAFGNPLPFGYEWRRGSATIASNTLNSYVNYFTFTAPTNITTQLYRVIVRNLASPATAANAQFNITTLADTDGDGIPDAWESSFGLDPNSSADRNLDSDGDGMSNYDEYSAGTDPTNALSYLRVDLASVPGSAALGFYAISNKTYTVRYTDALGSGPWFKLGDVLALTNNRVEVLQDTNWVSRRFYQLVTPRQP